MTMTDRLLFPMFHSTESNEVITVKARDLVFEPCPKEHAVSLVRQWHSRLPKCQNGPWTQAFRGHYDDKTYVVALWNNPSARTLPNNWRELRRMACAPDSPRNTPSRFLGWMAKWFQANVPECEKLISYQDTTVHKGTIYKAAGWTMDGQTVERVRDRTKRRTGTTRMYRANINSTGTDAASKIRWAKLLWAELEDRPRMPGF